MAQCACANGIAKIVIGLKPRLHLFRVPGMKLFARGKEALAQVLRKWRRISALDIEALELAHPISVDGRLAFEVVIAPNTWVRVRASNSARMDSGESPSLKHWTMESRDMRVPAT